MAENLQVHIVLNALKLKDVNRCTIWHQKNYTELLKKQNGKCAICGTTKPGNKGYDHFSIDHDHKTRKVRGLLCDKCNMAIGLLDDDPRTLIAAANYLLKAKE